MSCARTCFRTTVLRSQREAKYHAALISARVQKQVSGFTRACLCRPTFLLLPLKSHSAALYATSIDWETGHRQKPGWISHLQSLADFQRGKSTLFMDFQIMPETYQQCSDLRENAPEKQRLRCSARDRIHMTHGPRTRKTVPSRRINVFTYSCRSSRTWGDWSGLSVW